MCARSKHLVTRVRRIYKPYVQIFVSKSRPTVKAVPGECRIDDIMDDIHVRNKHPLENRHNKFKLYKTDHSSSNAIKSLSMTPQTDCSYGCYDEGWSALPIVSSSRIITVVLCTLYTNKHSNLRHNCTKTPILHQRVKLIDL